MCFSFLHQLSSLLSACLFPISFTVAIFALSKELSRALTLSWALCTLEVRLANLEPNFGSFPCPFYTLLPHHSLLSPPSQAFPTASCHAPRAVPSSQHMWLEAAWVLLVAPMQNSSWTLRQSFLSPLKYSILSSHMIFREKGQSVTLCHYPLQHNTGPLWLKAPYASLIYTVILLCPHISLNLLCSSVPLLPLPILLLMLSSTVVLLPFPHALRALLQGHAAKPLAAVLGQGWGWGPAKGCQEGFRPLWPLSLWREQGFLCLILSGKGDKQKEEAELSKELDRGDMFCRKGCMSNREQTLLEGVFNIWLAQSHSLEVYSYFIIFFFWLAFSYFP